MSTLLLLLPPGDKADCYCLAVSGRQRTSDLFLMQVLLAGAW